MAIDIFNATLLGVVEGLTEFIPVSSTAHILLLGRAIGFQSTGNVFEVLIQLGAVLAVVTVYFAKLASVHYSDTDSRYRMLASRLKAKDSYRPFDDVGGEVVGSQNRKWASVVPYVCSTT